MQELKSNNPPGLLSEPARERTETHKTISESTTNTIKTLAMLRVRSHLLSHKKSLVLSGKQKEINFLIFIGRCGHGAKAELGACVGPAWSQAAVGSSRPLPSCQGKQPLLCVPWDARPNRWVVLVRCLSPKPQQIPSAYRMPWFNPKAL